LGPSTAFGKYQSAYCGRVSSAGVRTSSKVEMVVWLRRLSLYGVFVSWEKDGQKRRGIHTDEPLYSSNSLESSSMSVYATLTCETGRSREERAVIDGAKKGSLDLPLSNMCMLGSREVMGDMACWRRIRTGTSGASGCANWRLTMVGAAQLQSCSAVGSRPAQWTQLELEGGGLTTMACRGDEHGMGAGGSRGVGKRRRALRAAALASLFVQSDRGRWAEACGSPWSQLTAAARARRPYGVLQ
jgi:hypothetical protein